MRVLTCILWLGLLGALASSTRAADLDEFKVKRAEVFVFAQKPSVQRLGDRVTVVFEAQDYCDATVAIENAEGKIVRHLACGVLGPKAPEPFQKNTLKQTLVWDGKDDRGQYMDDKQSLAIRVALGLRPVFERSLFWRPKLRQKRGNPLVCAAPEGVYVFEGCGVDHLRLFGHDGEYLRTLYPFPADRLDAVQGLNRSATPQDGRTLPFKTGFMVQTLLTSGASGVTESYGIPMFGSAATAMAVRGSRIALAQYRLNRLATDGSSGGLALEGGRTSFPAKHLGVGGLQGKEYPIGPTSMACSPDGKTVYLTGYYWRLMGFWDSLHGVAKLDYEKDAPATVFAGSMKQGELGGGDGRLNCPSSVDCDAQGRVYVSDFINDRIQVFGEDGKVLKSIPVFRPAQVIVHPKSQELYVFSWAVYSRALMGSKTPIEPKLTVFGPFENPQKKFETPLPVNGYRGHHDEWWSMEGVESWAALDAWTEPPTIWLAKQGQRQKSGYLPEFRDAGWETMGIQVLALEEGKLKLKRNFAADLKKSTARVDPPDFGRQRLYVNPKTELLYVGEDLGYAKSFKELVEIDPATGKERLVALPFDAEDLCFDQDGLAYLRTDTIVARYDPSSWREVPWDYGEERESHGFASGGEGKRSPILSGLSTPGSRPVCWNQGGMSVSPKGYLAVSCANREAESPRQQRDASLTWSKGQANSGGKPYAPAIYPGRVRWQEVHVWDKHGKPVYADAIPGSHILDGIGIDRDDKLYVMAAARRVLDGKPYFNEMSETLMKFKPRQARIVGTSANAAVPLTDAERPKKPPEISSAKIGQTWTEQAEWFYGGVGYGGFNTARAGGGCACWNARFCLDYFARSFAPEVDHFSVAVLDTNGNLILRVGKYGNADDGMPLVRDGGPANPRSLGGDEVALFHAAYVASFTDRRLFIADAGNGRIVSVKLGYHAEERIALKDVPDAGK